jgi:hypothetical protein
LKKKGDVFPEVPITQPDVSIGFHLQEKQNSFGKWGYLIHPTFIHELDIYVGYSYQLLCIDLVAHCIYLIG